MPPVLAKDWADAVAAADARAVARARAAVPEIKVTGPGPATGRRVAADGVVKVAPLVESALNTGALQTGAVKSGTRGRGVAHRSSEQATAPGETGAKGAPVRSALALSAQPPRPARKPAAAGHMAVLDTGSMVSLAQHADARVRS